MDPSLPIDQRRKIEAIRSKYPILNDAYGKWAVPDAYLSTVDMSHIQSIMSSFIQQRETAAEDLKKKYPQLTSWAATVMGITDDYILNASVGGMMDQVIIAIGSRMGVDIPHTQISVIESSVGVLLPRLKDDVLERIYKQLFVIERYRLSNLPIMDPSLEYNLSQIQHAVLYYIALITDCLDLVRLIEMVHPTILSEVLSLPAPYPYQMIKSIIEKPPPMYPGRDPGSRMDGAPNHGLSMDGVEHRLSLDTMRHFITSISGGQKYINYPIAEYDFDLTSIINYTDANLVRDALQGSHQLNDHETAVVIRTKVPSFFLSLVSMSIIDMGSLLRVCSGDDCTMYPINLMMSSIVEIEMGRDPDGMAVALMENLGIPPTPKSEVSIDHLIAAAYAGAYKSYIYLLRLFKLTHARDSEEMARIILPKLSIKWLYIKSISELEKDRNLHTSCVSLLPRDYMAVEKSMDFLRLRAIRAFQSLPTSPQYKGIKSIIIMLVKHITVRETKEIIITHKRKGEDEIANLMENALSLRL
jgi:hypothetical protein